MDFYLLRPESLGEAVDGLLGTVDRFTLNDDRAHQHAAGLGAENAAPLIVGRDVLLEERGEPHAVDKVINEG